MDSGQIVLFSKPATASRVSGNLWVGSAPPMGSGVSRAFDCLVLAAVEYQLDPAFFRGVEVLAAPLNDDGTPITMEEMATAVRAAGRVISWLAAGKRVLVTCHMGRNRSGLIAALALCMGPGKVPSEAAVAAVRAARGPAALSNGHFTGFLKAYCDRPLRRA